MYRLVRKFRARVKTQEIALLLITLAVAFALGRGFGVWYRDSGRDNWLILSVNAIDGRYAQDSAYEDDTGEPGAYSGYNLVAVNGGKLTDGFFTSPRAGFLSSANGVSASYLSLSSEAAGPEAEDSDDESAAPDSEPRGTDDHAGGDPNPEPRADNAGSRGESGIAGNADDSASDNRYGGEAEPVINSGDAVSTDPEDDPDLPRYSVIVMYNDERYAFQTVSKTVEQLFKEKGVVIAEDQKMTGAYLDGVINSDLFIKIKRVTTKSVVEDVKIPAKTVYRDNADLANGQSKVVRNGSDGLKRVEYLISYENGVQVGKDVVKETVVTEAVSKIVEQGASGTKSGKGGKDFKYKNVIDVKCTAYTNSYEDTGKRPGDPAFGITKSGMKAQKGVVAVDPSVIPLGTKMYIEILDDKIEDYGFCVAGDTGGKIKGKKVDLFFDATADQIKQFGVRKAKVYILD